MEMDGGRLILGTMVPDIWGWEGYFEGRVRAKALICERAWQIGERESQ